MKTDYAQLAKELLLELCAIPAPSGLEDQRAEYILSKLHSWGIPAFIDGAKNVISQYRGSSEDEIAVYAAHTDTVFPDLEPFEVREEGGKIYCPGCGDDTVAVAILMAALKKLHDEEAKPQRTVIFAFNSCEEGLGNLRGTRALMEAYGERTAYFITFDGDYDAVVNKSVGSHRYKVTVKTRGGHSFNDFGNLNAAAVLAEIIAGIYDIKVPGTGSKTTYNVGLIDGGTSVNTIIQEASMLCEYRSDDYDDLMFMQDEFAGIFDRIRTKYSQGAAEETADITVELVGERPCMKEVDQQALSALTDAVAEIQKKHGGCDVEINSGSTDCNIPHSMGIPAVCAGCYIGGGAHTREEWLEAVSIATGFDITEEIVRTLSF